MGSLEEYQPMGKKKQGVNKGNDWHRKPEENSSVL